VSEAEDRETILVVDDFKANVEFFTAILEGEYRVISAYEGETAISKARSERPDLVLLDIMMPGLDGYEVCRELKADPRTKSIPVIFVTALGEVEDEARAFEAGGADFLTKPVRPLVVLARVKTQLALRDQMRVLESMVRERTAELERTRFEIIRRLGRAAEFRDNETGLHVVRMGLFGERIALAYGLSVDDAELYLHALPMHDIGKIGIRDSILLKPGKLDEAETAEMRKHCEIGARILGEDSSSDVEPLAIASVCALSHHERWDGRGYPRGLSGEAIPLIGRIATVADVFDALTSKRPYKESWPIGRAAAEIQDGAGSQFDPEVVKAFAKALPEILEVRERYLET
jgi:putative two-component system response regulator